MAKTTDALVASAIKSLTDENGYPPTFRELASAVGLKSLSAMYSRLQRMRYKKLIAYEEGKYRTLKLTEKGEALADERA